MERLTTFVSSRGLLKSCVCHNSRPISSHPHIDTDLLAHHRPGGSIYVCTDALRNFAVNFLPHIQQPFVLVTGDSDAAISPALIADPAIAAILGNQYLLAWHAQNLSAQHAKLHHLPIGMDYHTMWEKPGLWGLTAVSPMAQEHSLQTIFAESPELTQRYLNGYCNWHFAIGRGDRQECFDKSDKSVCYYEANMVPRNSTWLRQAECMFVVSPEGAGMDCHRTWEAILLGCIPIVKKNPLLPLFAELPVMLVDDWSEVCRDAMLAFISNLGERHFQFSTLFREYWVRKITIGATASLMEPMTYVDFRRLIIRKTG